MSQPLLRTLNLNLLVVPLVIAIYISGTTGKCSHWVLQYQALETILPFRKEILNLLWDHITLKISFKKYIYPTFSYDLKEFLKPVHRILGDHGPQIKNFCIRCQKCLCLNEQNLGLYSEWSLKILKWWWTRQHYKC